MTDPMCKPRPEPFLTAIAIARRWLTITTMR
jgi:hypothetical protein